MVVIQLLLEHLLVAAALSPATKFFFSSCLNIFVLGCVQNVIKVSLAIKIVLNKVI